MPVDVALFGLHGAMVADGYDDCEGDLLARAREIVGPAAVVGAELDLHCHLTRKRVDRADLWCLQGVPAHRLPGARARIWSTSVPLPARGEHPAGRRRWWTPAGRWRFITSREPARGLVDRVMAMEGRDGLLSISIAHGFPWGDVPDVGTKVLVYSDAKLDAGGQRGAALAQRLADELTSLRHALAVPMPGIDEALDQALAFDGGPVVLADGADNPGGGAPGDSAFILQRLIERGIGNAIIGPLWDPVAARIASKQALAPRWACASAARSARCRASRWTCACASRRYGANCA